MVGCAVSEHPACTTSRRSDITPSWGIHLTGLAQVGGPPWPGGCRAVQARRMSPVVGRRRRYGLGLRAGDQAAVADGIVGDGEFEDPVEQQSPVARPAAVEAEYELGAVAGQVRVAHRALVGAEQPALGRGATR